MKNNLLLIIIALALIAFAGFAVHSFDVAHPKVVVQTEQAIPSSSVLSYEQWLNTPLPIANILVTNGSTTPQSCFFQLNGKCQMTLADFLSLESMLPALKALSSGKVLVSSDAVLVPTSATGTTPLTQVLQNIYQSLQTPTQQ